MSYSIKTKLVLSSVVPAVVTTLAVPFLAIIDMKGQRDHIANASKDFLAQSPNPSPDAMHDFVMQQWQVIFDMQIVSSLFGIFVLVALLIVASLLLVNTVTSGLNNLIKGCLLYTSDAADE